MKKITIDQVKELRKAGAKIPYIFESQAGRPVEVKPETKADPPEDNSEILKAMISVINANEANTGAIINVIHEMNKPKPKKKFISSVIRDARGNINKVETQEV
jgi:hypothetical protein